MFVEFLVWFLLTFIELNRRFNFLAYILVWRLFLFICLNVLLFYFFSIIKICEFYICIIFISDEI